MAPSQSPVGAGGPSTPSTSATTAASSPSSSSANRPLPLPSSFPAPSKASSKPQANSRSGSKTPSYTGPNQPANANSMIVSRPQAPTTASNSAPYAPAAAATHPLSNTNAAESTPPDLAALLAQAFQAQQLHGGQNGGGFVSAKQLHPEAADGPGSGSGAHDHSASAGDDPNNASSSSAGPSASSSANISRQVPAFLNKLRSMVDDKQTDNLICWSSDGRTFVVPNNIRFAKEVLPRFFKHNNFSSFVRQLNMYGFHKVPSLQQGSLKHEQEMELWEFENENFLRDKPELMANMQRKRGHKGGDREEEESSRSALVDGKVEEGLNSVSGALMRTNAGGQENESLMQLSNVWQAIQAIQSAQTSINDNLRHLHLSNDRLWQETMEQKQRSEKQSDTINRMLRFLAGIFGGQDVLAHGSAAEDGSSGSPSKGKSRGSGPGTLPRSNSSGSAGPNSLFRSPSSKGRLLIESGQSGESPGPDGREGSHGVQDGSDRIQELFSRFSEAGSTPPGSDTNSPTRPGSPEDSTSPQRFKQMQPSSKGGFVRPPHLGDTPRRPSTPGRSRPTPNQIMQALASGEGQAFIQQLLAGGAAAGNGQGKLDPNVLSALQGALAAFQAGGGGSGSGNHSSNSGNSNGSQNLSSAVGFPSPAGTDSNRFIYPYNTPTPPGQHQFNNQQLEAFASQSQAGPLSQPLSEVDASAEMLQNAINQLAGACGADTPNSNGLTNGQLNGNNNGSNHSNNLDYGVFPAGSLPSGSGHTPSSTMAPGDWNHFAGVTPSGFQGSNETGNTGSGDFDLSALIDDSLMSNYLNSPGDTGNIEANDTSSSSIAGVGGDNNNNNNNNNNNTAAGFGKKRKSPEAEDTTPTQSATIAPTTRAAASGNDKPHKFGRTRVEDAE